MLTSGECRADGCDGTGRWKPVETKNAAEFSAATIAKHTIGAGTTNRPTAPATGRSVPCASRRWQRFAITIALSVGFGIGAEAEDSTTVKSAFGMWPNRSEPSGDSWFESANLGERTAFAPISRFHDDVPSPDLNGDDISPLNGCVVAHGNVGLHAGETAWPGRVFAVKSGARSAVGCETSLRNWRQSRHQVGPNPWILFGEITGSSGVSDRPVRLELQAAGRSKATRNVWWMPAASAAHVTCAGSFRDAGVNRGQHMVF